MGILFSFDFLVDRNNEVGDAIADAEIEEKGLEWGHFHSPIFQVIETGGVKFSWIKFQASIMSFSE